MYGERERREAERGAERGEEEGEEEGAERGATQPFLAKCMLHFPAEDYMLSAIIST